MAEARSPMSFLLRSGGAVGLSAISLLASIPSRFPNLASQIPFPKLVPDSLAKDAAPIPNASGATQARMLPYILINKV